MTEKYPPYKDGLKHITRMRLEDIKFKLRLHEVYWEDIALDLEALAADIRRKRAST